MYKNKNQFKRDISISFNNTSSTSDNLYIDVAYSFKDEYPNMYSIKKVLNISDGTSYKKLKYSIKV